MGLFSSILACVRTLIFSLTLVLSLLALTASQKVPCDDTKDILEENPTKMAGNRERTFIMLKPDAVQRGLVGEIIKRFEQKGFKLVAMKMMHASEELLKEHYRGAVIFFGMPPYTFWHENPKIGRIPPHRTDTGSYLVSEVFGAKSMIFIKDEEGLYTADPKKDPDAKFIKRISVKELKSKDLKDVVVERPVLDFMESAKNRRSIRIINGLVKGNLTRALNGEEIGTEIYVDDN